jgi:hypothetical protein
MLKQQIICGSTSRFEKFEVPTTDISIDFFGGTSSFLGKSSQKMLVKNVTGKNSLFWAFFHFIFQIFFLFLFNLPKRGCFLEFWHTPETKIIFKQKSHF